MSGTPRIVNPGNPPILWSSVDEAFKAINQNFNDLYATIQADGSTEVVNFEQLISDVAPESAGVYDLGNRARPWRAVYASAWQDKEGSENNGLWAGDAQIRGIGSVVDLPVNSTVGGELIVNPNNTFFKSVEVDGENRVEADEFVDTLNLISGGGIGLTVDSAAESIIISNLGVESLTPSTGLSVNFSTGNVVITNTGVTSIANTQGLPDGRSVGAGIRRDSASGAVTLTNTGILDVQQGSGINVDVTDGVATIAFNSGVAPQSAFTRIHVDGVSVINDVISDSTTDTLNLEPGYGMIMNSNPSTDRISFSVDQNIDINGSVYGDDSTLLVDGTNNTIPAENLTGTASINLQGNTAGIHTGDVIGSVFADDSTVLVDAVDGLVTGNVKTDTISSPNNGDLNIAGSSVAKAGDGNDIGIFGGNNTGAGDAGGVGIFGGVATGGGQGGSITLLAGAGATPGIIGIGGGEIQIGYLAGDAVTIGTVSQDDNIFYGKVTGDLSGSVYADDSTLLVDGVDGKIPAQNLTGTATIDIIGSVFADDSTLLVNGVDGSLAYNAEVSGDWNGTAPSTVGEALDRIAAWITANGGAGSP